MSICKQKTYSYSGQIVRCLLVKFILLIGHYASADFVGKVVAVTDGDTIKVLDEHNLQYKVRLAGIDAPEKNQPFGEASRKHLASILADKLVYVSTDRSDRYGRLLGKILIDGEDANLEQVRSGYAWWYRKYAHQQSKADRTAYELSEKFARQNKLGLWADDQPVPPWAWRKKKK